jgi:hypothetical protein
MPAPERLRRARRPLAALPLHCVRNRGQPVRKFQSIAIPPAHRQAMTEAVSPRFLVLHRPAYGLGRAARSPRSPDGSWRRRRHLLLGAPLFVPCPGTSGFAKSLSLMPEASQFPWRQELCDASAPLLLRARAKCVALQPARFRASARPSGALTTVPHITAAQAAGTGCSFDRCKAAATRDAPLVLPSPPPQSTRRGSTRNLERVWDGTLADRLTRTSTLASPRQTDSVVNARNSEGPARPRRCGCVRLGCHMQKFQDPRVA